MYLVDGNRMRIDCTGSGSPTIILDAGAGNDGLIWSAVQPVLARSTRVCSYDRPGMGWSDAQPVPGDADHIATALHGLLAAAKVDGPVVLMGHSRAGIYIRDYATRYPADVAGLIFVDSSTPFQDNDPAFRAYDTKARAGRFELFLNEAAFAAGIPRLFGACSDSFPEFDELAARLYQEDRCHENFGANEDQEDSVGRSYEETKYTGPYGALPILIFSHDRATDASRGRPTELVNAATQMQEDLKKLSTRSRRIIARGSGHYVHLDRPDLVETEVADFIQQIRGTAGERPDYGSTKTE
jgi:pimeloyl-ACP methyl ester carboxylesterase